MKNEKKETELERENTILKRPLQKGKSKRSNINFSLTFANKRRDKSASFIKNFNRKLRTIKHTDIEYISGKELVSATFGTVKMGKIISIAQVVAVKPFNKNASNASNLVKTPISDEMSGHPFFLFCFVIVNPDNLLLKYVFGETLREILPDDLGNFQGWKTPCMDIVRGMSSLHVKGILHNDLHSRNILLINRQFIKIIDFGKACMVENLPVYNIKPSPEKQKRYNKLHIWDTSFEIYLNELLHSRVTYFQLHIILTNMVLLWRQINLWQLQQECCVKNLERGQNYQLFFYN